MFKIKAPEKIPATLTIVGQGREQKLKLTYRHKTREQFAEFVDSVAKGEKTACEAVLEIVESWEADAPLDADSIAVLQSHQPGADWAIVNGYSEALAVARKGN